LVQDGISAEIYNPPPSRYSGAKRHVYIRVA